MKIRSFENIWALCIHYLRNRDHEFTLRWNHNERDGVSNHQPHDCLLNRLFRRRSKKTPKLRVTGLCKGIHGWPVNCPHKAPFMRKIFPFDDVNIHIGFSENCLLATEQDTGGVSFHIQKPLACKPDFNVFTQNITSMCVVVGKSDFNLDSNVVIGKFCRPTNTDIVFLKIYCKRRTRKGNW